MARISRSFIDNCCYHIYSRGNEKKNIFLDDQDYVQYLTILKKSKKKYNILLYAYCLMPNHIHLLIDTKTGKNISRFMHWATRGYTAYFNRKYNKVGHLWQGRFKSKPLLKNQYLLNCASYIEANPLRASLTLDLSEYLWSSYKERCCFSGHNILDEILVNSSDKEWGHFHS